MPDVKDIIEGLEMSYKFSNVDEENTLVPQELVLHIIMLLRKQEPIRPMIGSRDRDIQLFNCGACGGVIGAGGIAKYCFHCGRAVKWDG